MRKQGKVVNKSPFKDQTPKQPLTPQQREQAALTEAVQQAGKRSARQTEAVKKMGKSNPHPGVEQ